MARGRRRSDARDDDADDRDAAATVRGWDGVAWRRGWQPVFGWPSLVRFSWATVREMFDEKAKSGVAARVVWAADDADGAGDGTPKVSAAGWC